MAKQEPVPSRIRETVRTWGTVIYFDVASSKVSEDELRAGVAEVADLFYLIDDLFSTYKSESEVSRLRSGRLALADCHVLVREVWDLCLAAKELSDGYFDPWCVEGGFDPSGYVKGWAADKGVEILKKHGAENIQINCAGDLTLAGGFEDGKP